MEWKKKSPSRGFIIDGVDGVGDVGGGVSVVVEVGPAQLEVDVDANVDGLHSRDQE